MYVIGWKYKIADPNSNSYTWRDLCNNYGWTNDLEQAVSFGTKEEALRDGCYQSWRELCVVMSIDEAKAWTTLVGL